MNPYLDRTALTPLFGLLVITTLLLALASSCGEPEPTPGPTPGPTESQNASSAPVPTAVPTAALTPLPDPTPTPTAVAKVPRKPYDGPYCAYIDFDAYRALTDVEREEMRAEMLRVRDENFPELDNHPAGNSWGFGIVRRDGPQREMVGIRVGFDVARLTPGEPSPQQVYPKWIGCVPLEIGVSEGSCEMINIFFDTREFVS